MDVSLQISTNSSVEFKYFEMEMSSNTVIHCIAAVEDNQKTQIPTQEMARRIKGYFPLTNCGRELRVGGKSFPCSQGAKELPGCKRRNTVYDSICATCNIKQHVSTQPSLHERSKVRLVGNFLW